MSKPREWWQDQLAKASQAMKSETTPDEVEAAEEESAPSAPTISDTGQHPEVQMQPDPGATE